VNLDRRMLTKGQKAMIAAKAGALTERKRGNQARTAETAGVSAARVRQAETVLAHAPDLADAVVAGTWTLDAAYDEARRRKADLESDERRLERLKSSRSASGMTRESVSG